MISLDHIKFFMLKITTLKRLLMYSLKNLQLIDLMIRIQMKSLRRPRLLKKIKEKNNILKNPQLKLHSLMILQAQET